MSNDEEEEGTEVDVQVDMPSLITASVETASPAGRPPDDEPSTSPFALRAPVTKHRTGPQLPVGVSRPATDASTDDSSVSLVTPRFDTNELAKQIAFAETMAARSSGSSGPNADPDETEEEEVGTTKRRPVRELDEATLERRAPADADDERTLDARTAGDQLGAIGGVPRVGPEPGEEETTTRRDSPLAASGNEEQPEDDRRDEAPGYPPMRPRYDSEAAAQWPPWHAQPEEARAALRGVVSPVASGTEVMPRSTVEEAFRMLASGQMEQARGTGQAVQPPHHVPPRPDPFAPDPLAHRLETPAPQPSMLPGPSLPAPSASVRASHSTPSGTVKRGVSPFTVFLLAFLFTGGIFGGLIASRRIPIFAAAPTAPPMTTVPPVTSEVASTTIAPAASESTSSAAESSAAPPSASASVIASSSTVASASASGSSAAAPSASASAAPSTTRPKTKGGPRRGKPR